MSEIEIQIVLTPNYFQDMAHLEIRSIAPERSPLPITETGYRSHFFAAGAIDLAEFDPVEEVRAWLDEGSRSAQWKAHVQADRQLQLL